MQIASKTRGNEEEILNMQDRLMENSILFGISCTLISLGPTPNSLYKSKQLF